MGCSVVKKITTIKRFGPKTGSGPSSSPCCRPGRPKAGWGLPARRSANGNTTEPGQGVIQDGKKDHTSVADELLVRLVRHILSRCPGLGGGLKTRLTSASHVMRFLDLQAREGFGPWDTAR